jgi:hypothetical protein
MVVSRLYHELAQGAKQVSDLVLTRYIKDLINCLYIVGSTIYESKVESLNFFRFVSISVAMDLQCIISNLIDIPRLRKISSDLITLLIPRYSTFEQDPPSQTLRPTPSVTEVGLVVQSDSLSTPSVTKKKSISQSS